MPPLPGFSDNSFRTRRDLIHAAVSLVKPLDQYKSQNNARIKVATATGAGFSEIAAQLEGFARPLWVVADLLYLEASNDASSSLTEAQLDTWIIGLKAGTDPTNEEYWGDLSDFDQRMVEMESIAYALLSNPDAFRFGDDERARMNVIAWLKQINEHKMPQSNWLWFRVLVNLAMVKTLGVPLEDVRASIDESLKTLDTFFMSDGWSSDGLWCEERRQADYYSGSFAIQFAQLLYVRFVPGYDPLRTETYRQQARQFAKEYWRYFDTNGAAIPFGRSLTYRYAFAAFWAAAVRAGVDLPAPVDKIGTVKGLLLRHLRWWAKQPHIFNTDGTPSIGYTYPNMYMSEDYNSPQSVYWCLKSFLILALDEESAFWVAEELPHPLSVSASLQTDMNMANVELLPAPRHIMCNTPEHTFLLSSGQSTSKRFKAREAKYGKFAYSSAFGFSVPCGPFLEQIAPDSTLAMSLSEDSEEHWSIRWTPHDVTFGVIEAGGERVPTLTSRWKPWKRLHVVVRTMLVPPVKRWPGWSMRSHHVEWSPETTDRRALRLVDGGFAASAQTSGGVSIFEQPLNRDSGADEDDRLVEGWWIDEKSALVLSESGASGIVDLTSEFAHEADANVQTESSATIIRADPNTNLIAQRSLIPAARHHLHRHKSGDLSIMYTFITGIFAVEAGSKASTSNVWQMWYDRPKGRFDAEGNLKWGKLDA